MKEDWEKLRARLRSRVQDRLDLSRELTDEEVQALIDEEIMACSRSSYLLLEEKLRMQKELFHAMRRLDILQELIEDPEVTEIMVNGPDHIFIEKKGRIFRWERRFSTRIQLEDVVQQIVSFCNRSVTKASPIADARLADGSRVNIVLDPVALNGPVITIRRFPEEPVRIAQLVSWGSLTEEAVEFLKAAVQAGYNIFVSGGTGSGKTTFLNALSEFIPETARVITIEDNAELQLDRVRNLVTLEARGANLEGEREITIRDLIRTALRMRPDRIIVGEVRGAEAIDMLQAMNTGHDGSLSTGHANSPRDMLSRLETMVLMGMELPLMAIRRQISSGVDLIVHLGRLRDGSRRVLEIVETDGIREGEICLHTLFEFQEDVGEDRLKVRGSLRKRDGLFHEEKMRAAGIGG
ncbi:CpaF family protein [Lachnoclostridium sp. An138]|uniref:CpaF family protein n=1 Tax=Lachnoclostridium sp. An138 TaxID=1965560 RepID=UPI000B39678B|nr:CpaF family protein [Lachnoclostridium sp. An138]OUQ17991.1 pilus assembly protein [Lachnoclostridium sp. An138]